MLTKFTETLVILKQKIIVRQMSENRKNRLPSAKLDCHCESITFKPVRSADIHNTIS